MRFDDFINWLLTQGRVDYDGFPKANPYQCVDIIKFYADKVYGMEVGSWGDAKYYWLDSKHPLLAKFSRVYDRQPERGDIVIYDTSASTEHIFIALSNTQGIEQNGGSGKGLGTGTDAIRRRSFDKSRIMGILRPIESEVDMPTKAEVELMFSYHQPPVKPKDGQVTYYMTREWVVLAKDILENNRKAVTTLQTKQKELQTKVTTLTKENETLKAQVGDSTKWQTFKALIKELIS